MSPGEPNIDQKTRDRIHPFIFPEVCQAPLYALLCAAHGKAQRQLELWHAAGNDLRRALTAIRATNYVGTLPSFS